MLYALVWSGKVEVRLVLLHHSMQMSLAQDEKKVQALPSHAAEKALADGICLRRAIRCPQHLNSSVLGHPSEGSTVVLAEKPVRSGINGSARITQRGYTP